MKREKNETCDKCDFFKRDCKCDEKKTLHILHIYEDEDHTLEQTTEEVLKLLKTGCTSGIDPDWDIEVV